MNKENNNMDDFLRSSISELKVEPSQNVWKKLSKRLLILELVRLNFTNIGKSWLYSGLAVFTTVAGITYFQTNHDLMGKDNAVLSTNKPTSAQDQTKTRNTETYQINEKDIAANASPKTETTQQSAVTDAVESKSVVEQIENVVSENRIVSNNEITNPKPITDKTAPSAQQTNKAGNDYVKPSAPVNQHIAQTITREETQVKKVNPHNLSGKSNTLIISFQGGSKAIPPLVIGGKSQTGQLKTSVPGSSKKAKSSKIAKTKFDKESSTLGLQEQKTKWAVSFSYLHNWPLDEKDYISPSSQFTINGSLIWKKFEFSTGIGIRSDKTTARLENSFSSYDSVGYYFDIDYYETIPENPDSIIIHYVTKAVFDTVSHQRIQEADQRSRWIIVPIEIGYEILHKNAYVLKAKINARFGWEYYRETIIPENIPSINGFSSRNIGAESVNPFISIGFGLENQFKLYQSWWFILEPRAFYYVKKPYKWENSKPSGPFGIGIKAGIKFKF